MSETTAAERHSRLDAWMSFLLLMLDPFQRATDRPQLASRDTERDDIDAMHNEGNPNHHDDDEREKYYRPDCLDPVYDRYSGFRQ
jgi:hypothetical protein